MMFYKSLGNVQRRHNAAMLLIVLLGAISSISNGFAVYHQNSRPRPHCSIPTTALPATNKDSNEERRSRVFDSKGWPDIKKDMNTVPVFCVAHPQGQPLKYQVNEYQLAFFFCDVEASKVELAKAKKETDIEGLDIVPYPLGEVFEMASENQAIIIPSAEALSNAGAPVELDPIGAQVPLFCCMEIMQELEDGTGVLPLFFTLKEAQDAVRQAVGKDGGDTSDFEISGLSLEKAVEALSTVPETPAFQFMTPAASIEHIRKYLSD